MFPAGIVLFAFSVEKGRLAMIPNVSLWAGSKENCTDRVKRLIAGFQLGQSF